MFTSVFEIAILIIFVGSIVFYQSANFILFVTLNFLMKKLLSGK